jgi:hypothetical protein
MIRSDAWALVVFDAVIRRRICGITSRIGPRRMVERPSARSWIELRQAIERYVGEIVVAPILPQGSEVMIEAAILLHHEDNMVQDLYGLSRGTGLCSPSGLSPNRSRTQQGKVNRERNDMDKFCIQGILSACRIKSVV